MDLNNVMLAIVNLIYSQDLPSLDIYQHTHLLVHDYPSWSTFGLHLVRGPKTSYIEVFNNQTIEVRPWSRRMEKSHLSWFHLIVHGANKLFNDAKQLSWLLSYSQPTKPLIEGILSKRKVRNHAVLGGGQGLKGCETKVNHSSTGNRKLQCWQLLVSYIWCLVWIHMDNELGDMAFLAGTETWSRLPGILHILEWEWCIRHVHRPWPLKNSFKVLWTE